MLGPVDERAPEPEDVEEPPTAEWRIERIDPAEGVNPRSVYGVPALLFVALLLVVVLAVMLLTPLLTAADSETPFFSRFTPAHIFMLGLLLLCAAPLTWGLITAVRRLVTPDPWVELEAVCEQRDIQPVPVTDPAARPAYSYRLFCRFEYHGFLYEVTPDGDTEPQPRRFDSPEAAVDFLAEHLDPDGRTRLRINIRNPLDAKLTASPE